MHNTLLAFTTRFVRNCDVQIAVVTRIGGAGKVTFYFITFIYGHRAGGVEYSLPRIWKSGGTRKERRQGTDFQWVYWAWGPVENLTFLWVHSKEMSNQAKKAWMSGQDPRAFRRVPASEELAWLTVITGAGQREGCNKSKVLFFGG